MVRRDVARTRIARASTWLDAADQRFSLEADVFVAATQDRDLALFYLLLALQECIDLAAHWVADAGWGVPDDAGSPPPPPTPARSSALVAATLA